MPDSTRLPRDVRWRLRMQGMSLVLIPLLVVLVGGFFWMAWTLLAPLPPDPELDAYYAERAAWLEEHRRAFDQMLDNHAALYRALQEGR